MFFFEYSLCVEGIPKFVFQCKMTTVPFILLLDYFAKNLFRHIISTHRPSPFSSKEITVLYVTPIECVSGTHVLYRLLSPSPPHTSLLFGSSRWQVSRRFRSITQTLYPCGSNSSQIFQIRVLHLIVFISLAAIVHIFNLLA
jgi:hypothetical protein